MPREQSVSSVVEIHSAHIPLNTEFCLPCLSLPGKAGGSPGKKQLGATGTALLSLFLSQA